MSELDLAFQRIWDKRAYVDVTQQLIALANENHKSIGLTILSWNEWRQVKLDEMRGN